MTEETYNNLGLFFIFLTGVMYGVIISLLLIE